MNFYTINQQKNYETIAEAVVGREQEIYHYDLNITNYEAMLLSLPQDDWPENLVQYQRSTLDQVPDEHDQTVSDYQYRDRIKVLLKTERLERNKAFRIYEVLLNQLPEDQRETLITEAHQRILSRGQ
jgi:lipopolysaccharide export LptBFGC system permease protein LptF